MRTFGVPGLFFRQWASRGLLFLLLLRAGQMMADDDTNSVKNQLSKSFEDIRGRYQAETNNAALAWQFARACFDMSTLQKDLSREAVFAEQGIDASRQSLAVSNSVQAHYYLGMNIGQFADTRHNLAGLRMVKDMEREFLASELLDEHFDYGGPDRNLGLLYRETPVIVSIGSRSKSRQHLEKAVELAPDFPENRLNLIESYLKWDYRAEALRALLDLEKIWPDARKKYIGEQWVLSWADWNKRLVMMKKKLGANSKVIESPHSAP